MIEFNRRITDQEPEYPPAWPFILSGLIWGVIFGLMWVW